jgi:hypothetical protein
VVERPAQDLRARIGKRLNGIPGLAIPASTAELTDIMTTMLVMEDWLPG